jgi:serine/threonine protein kinase
MDLLAEDQFKHTYFAVDMSVDRNVTLVLIRPEMGANDSSRIAGEIRILGQVGVHENIVTLYDYGVADDVSYLVFQYMSGGTLDYYIQNMERSGQQLTIEEVRRLGRQLARALVQVHDHGITHNGVDPRNIWLDERRVVHLGGFELAVRQYAAPELQVGVRSDLYSFGAVLYYVLTGKPPLRGKQGLVEPLKIRQDIPIELDTLICQLLADSSDNRPSSATEVLELLLPAAVRPPSDKGIARGPETAAERDADKKGFASWLETLPFPVASILWRYHAAYEPQRKVDNLVKFFEALVQLLVTVQLSAYIRDRSLFDSRSSMSSQKVPGKSYRFDLRVPTFGTWVKLYQDLSGMIQDILKEESGAAARCYELFATRSNEHVQLLADSDLGSILQQALHNRNAWIGHGGAASDQEHKRRLAVLEVLLRRTETVLGTTFETWNLLKPGYAAFANGLYSLRAENLMGVNSDFVQVEVPLQDPSDINRLYLLNGARSLELVPLMKVLTDEKTGQNACYFFSRMQGDEIRWISHHFEAESELSLYDSGVVELLSKLRGK